MTRSLSFALVASLLAGAAAHAAPLAYDEAVAGDLPMDPPRSFVFDVGVNTFTGTFGRLDFSGGNDFDTFSFTVPAGLRVTQGSISVADVPGDGGRFNQTDLFLNAGSLAWFGGTRVQYLSVSTSEPGTVAVPLEAGDYNVSQSGVSGSDGVPQLADYVVSFTVVAVPEPTTLAALAGVALLATRRRRA